MKLRPSRRAAGPAAAHNSRHGPRSAPTITALQRNAIYQQILDRLSHMGDLGLLVEQDDLAAARRLAREVTDDLQLVLDGLGWGEAGSGAPVELDLPVEQLRRTFSRLRERAVEEEQEAEQGEEFAQEFGGDFAQEIAEVFGDYERSRIVIETCDQVLAAVGGESR